MPVYRLRIIETIRKVADELVMYKEVGLIVNRALYPDRIREESFGGVRIISVIPQDDAMTENDMEGRSIFELSDDAGILKGADTALKNFKIY